MALSCSAKACAMDPSNRPRAAARTLFLTAMRVTVAHFAMRRITPHE